MIMSIQVQWWGLVQICQVVLELLRTQTRLITRQIILAHKYTSNLFIIEPTLDNFDTSPQVKLSENPSSRSQVIATNKCDGQTYRRGRHDGRMAPQTIDLRYDDYRE
jgi:hypothetical protein